MGLLNNSNILAFHQHMRDQGSSDDYEGVLKKARPARPQPLGWAERTEEYVSPAKGRERRWRHFSTLPVYKAMVRRSTRSTSKSSMNHKRSTVVPFFILDTLYGEILINY